MIFYYFQKSLDQKFEKQEKRRKKSHELQIKKDELDNKKSSCYGKLFFWMYKYITDNSSNKELDRAFDELQKTEEEIKEFERRRLAEFFNDDY